MPIYTRIQSTALEQKRWEAVIHGAGPDFFFRLATEKELLFHDQSERQRLTRAFWQGVPFLIHLFRWSVDLPEIPCLMRGGIRVNSYFNQVIRNSISSSTLKEIKYFKKFMINQGAIIFPCKIRLKGLDKNQ